MRQFLLTALACLVMTVTMAQTKTPEAVRLLSQSEYAHQQRSLQEMDSADLISGRCEIYRLDIPQNRSYLLDDLLKAFDRDQNEAYYQLMENSGNTSRRTTALTYGTDGESVLIGENSDQNYRVICFVDKNRENYRYGYAVEWNETDNGCIAGRLTCTYGLRPNSNNKKSISMRLENMKDLSELGEIIPEAIKSIKVIGKDKLKDLGNLEGLKDLGDYLGILTEEDDMAGDIITDDVQWLTTFNHYRNAFNRAADRKSSTAASYATNILKLCKNADKVKLSANEKKLCVKSIKQMRQRTKDSFVQGLLDEAIDLLK